MRTGNRPMGFVIAICILIMGFVLLAGDITQAADSKEGVPAVAPSTPAQSGTVVPAAPKAAPQEGTKANKPTGFAPCLNPNCPCHRQIGFAKFYTERSCKREGTSGIWTASGAKFDEGKMTCALPSPAKFGDQWKITNLANGKTILVICTDRGPNEYARSRCVVVDLTPAAFKALGFNLREGKGKVLLCFVESPKPALTSANNGLRTKVQRIVQDRQDMA